jgi:hypothetical protein
MIQWGMFMRIYSMISMNSLGIILKFVRRFQHRHRDREFCKPAVCNDSLHETSNDNGVAVMNYHSSKYRVVKMQCSPITEFINALLKCPDGKIASQIDCVLIANRIHVLVLSLKTVACESVLVWWWLNFRRDSVNK